MAICAASAAAAPVVPEQLTAVDRSAASHPAFVPEWDGENDTTQVQYRVLTDSVVRVLLLDGRGRIRRVLEAGRRTAGTHETYWDGRDSSGTVLPAGSYRIRVVARPVAAGAGEPGGSSLGGVPVVAGSKDIAVVLQQAPVAVRSIHLSRGSIGAGRAISSTTARYELSRAATVSAVVTRPGGQVVRTLAMGRMKAGPVASLWSGRDGSGRAVADGTYEVLVAATDGGRPTETIRVPVRIDRHVPSLGTARAVRASATHSAVTVPVAVRTDEASTVVLRMGARTARVAASAGLKRIVVRGSALGVHPSSTRRTLPMTVSVRDATGNVRSARVLVVVPGVQAPAPPRHVAHAPSPAPAAATGGKLGWPVVGAVITSEFGPRDGRMHEGMDFGVPVGTRVYAASGGTVSYVGQMSGYGNIVILQHPGGLETRYAHLSAPAAGLVVGDGVSQGGLIALSGNTGHSTGPHLHFETRISGIAKNPRGYLPG